MIQVTQLYIYPIKGCAGIPLQSTLITEVGLKYDREFVLVDNSGRFLSQRRFPKMCLISMVLSGEILIVRYPGKPHLVIPLMNREKPESAPCAEIEIFGKIGWGFYQGPTMSDWFSDCLGIECKLYRYNYIRPRRRNGDESNIAITFADGFPALIISEESLKELNRQCPIPIDMRRFRPNIVVAGCSGPNQEDHWNYIALGTASFRGQKLCECCNTILVNPDDGTTGHEPLKTLEEYRVIPSMPGKPPGPVVFGKNVSVTHVGTVTIGSQLISDYEYRRPEPNELPLIIVA